MKKLLLLSFVFVTATMPAGFSVAGEINYGHLEAQRGDTLLLEYRGPAGVRHYMCSINTADCTYRGTSTPNLFPSILGNRSYETNENGTLAVKEVVVGDRAYYFLYDIEGSTPKKLALIPYTTPGANIYFARNDEAVLFKHDSQWTRYDIETKKIHTVTIEAPSLPFLTVFPDGNYIAAYDYTALHHFIWRLLDGKRFDGPSSMQSYMEFSDDGEHVAYLEDIDSFKTLFTAPFKAVLAGSPSVTQLTKPETETEDYLFVGNMLSFLANVSGPYGWDLSAYTAAEDDTSLIEYQVSYGDFLTRVTTEDAPYLAYLKTEGKNTDVVLYNNTEKEKKPLKAVGASHAEDTITREEVVIAGRHGVLLSPEKPKRNANLFVWLHGGPQRQVAVGYHPYLSYAVYDELLERLAAGGNYVLKLDYTGSSGYGAAFRKALHLKIGEVDVTDVKNAIDEMEDEYSIRNVYLIGNSYGGYLALKGIAELPNKVDGAVSINGVTDWYSLINKIPSSVFTPLFEGTPDLHNIDAYYSASVYSGMKELTDEQNILVVWGENDATVPTWQSTNYLEFSASQDVTVHSLMLSGEDHIIRKRENLDTLCKSVVDAFELSRVQCSL